MAEKKVMNVYKDKDDNYYFKEVTPDGEQCIFNTKWFLWDRIIRYQHEGYTLKFYNMR